MSWPSRSARRRSRGLDRVQHRGQGTALGDGLRVAGDLPLEPGELIGQGDATIRLLGRALELDGAIELSLQYVGTQDVAAKFREEVDVKVAMGFAGLRRALEAMPAWRAEHFGRFADSVFAQACSHSFAE